jgi:acyl carrier protein
VNRTEIVQALTEILEQKGLVFAENMTILEDTELDSYALVSIILEMEEAMNVTFDDDTQILFGESPLSKICDHLSTLA